MKELKPSDLVWSTFYDKEENEEGTYQVIYDDKILSPWKLIKKNK